MMRSRPRLLAAVAALTAMFFAQAAFALAACGSGQEQSRVRMIAAPVVDSAPCHEPADNANLCLTHCQAGEQTLDKHQVKVPDVSAEAVLVVRALPQTRRIASSAPRTPSPAAGPPLRIIYRTFLI